LAAAQRERLRKVRQKIELFAHFLEQSAHKEPTPKRVMANDATKVHHFGKTLSLKRLRVTAKFMWVSEAVVAVADPCVLRGLPSKADCARARTHAPVRARKARSHDRKRLSVRSSECPLKQMPIYLQVGLLALPACRVRLQRLLVASTETKRWFADQPRPSRASNAD